MMFEVTGSRKERYALQVQRARYVRNDWAVLSGGTVEGAVAEEILHCSDAVHGVLCNVASAMVSTLHILMENNHLYT